MSLITQVHLEFLPLAAFQDSHPPITAHIFRELPEYVETLFIRESFVVSLLDSANCTHKSLFHGIQNVPPIVDIGSGQDLKGINRVHGFQV